MLRRKKSVGLPPGAIVFTGERKVEEVRLHYLQYDGTDSKDVELPISPRMTFGEAPLDKIDWYDVRGMHDAGLIERIGTAHGIHPLVLEDISDVHQRPKFEEYPDGIFLIVKSLSFDPATERILQEHVAIYLKEGLVLSFQETESDLFSVIRDRIKAAYGRIRTQGADYLAYALIDLLTDNYFLVLEAVEARVEILEDKLLVEQDAADKARIHQLKRQLLAVRKTIGPLREAIGRFHKSEHAVITPTTKVFLRDLYDHTIQVMDMVESYRDILNGLQELFVSELSLKMNQVMQVLTIVSALFIPLTFLAGLYGMNFRYIPELEYRYGYFVLLGIMLVIFVGLLLFFRRKRWL